jgi:glycosyltransferase involved in cell wall biosynthesis
VLVSIVTPTHGRARLLPRLARCFARQSYPELELVVLDDSPEPAASFTQDPRVRYVHDPVRTSIGHKRNRLLELARGELVVHFDDDDLYAPGYVAAVVDKLSGADFFTFSAWHLWRHADRSLWYWDTTRIAEPHFVVGGAPHESLRLLYPAEGVAEPARRAFVENNLWGYGFSYAYRRDLARRVEFPDRDHGEDLELVQRLGRQGARIAAAADPEGLVLHVLHEGSTSRCFPQYRLPAQQLGRLAVVHGVDEAELSS